MWLHERIRKIFKPLISQQRSKYFFDFFFYGRIREIINLG